jgi:micrococcal nuclease
MARIVPFKRRRQTYWQPRKRTYFAPSNARILSLSILLFVAIWHLPTPWIAGAKSLSLANGLPGMNHYGLCHSGGGYNCVVDGDTFYHDGQKIRIADIDTPETHPPRCAHEAELGEAATLRLQALLNAGPFSLQSIDRDSDKYGRKLRTVMRDGRSIGGQLVGEGLARYYGGGRQRWC